MSDQGCLAPGKYILTSECKRITLLHGVMEQHRHDNLILGCTYDKKKYEYDENEYQENFFQIEFQIYLSAQIEEPKGKVRYLCVQNFTNCKWILKLKNISSGAKEIVIPPKMLCKDVYPVDTAEYDEINIEIALTKVQSKIVDPDQQLRDLVESGLNQLNNALYTDLVVNSNDGHKRHTHKSVLAAASAVWGAMFTHEMVEAMSGEVTILELDAGGLDSFLQYVYTRASQDIPPNYSEQMMVVADKYNLLHLKESTEDTMCDLVTVDNVLYMFKIANLYELKKLQLKSNQLLNSPEFVDSRQYRMLDDPNTLKCIISKTEVGQQFTQATVHFVFDNIENLLEEKISSSFYWKDLRWYLRVAPFVDTDALKYLSIHLVSKAYLKNNWSCKTSVVLEILNSHRKKCVRFREHDFTHSATQIGYKCMIPLEELVNPSNGFIQDNEITVAVSVSTMLISETKVGK